KSNGIGAFVGYTASTYANNNPAQGLQCPIGVASLTTQGASVHRSLDMSTRPGELIGLLPGTGGSPDIWYINQEDACGHLTDVAKNFVQSGSSLMDAAAPPSSSNSLSLNGAGAYVEVADNNSLDIETAITVEAWIKTATPSAPQQGIVERYKAIQGVVDGGF